MNTLENSFSNVAISRSEYESITFQYVSVFKNPNKLPINQIHLERNWYEIKHDIPKDLDSFELSNVELQKNIYEKKTEIIPALDRRWLPKLILSNFEPYVFTNSLDENADFINKNQLFLDGLNYLLKCNYHQFWCTIFFEPSAAVSLRSFILNPITPHEMIYLEKDFFKIYNTVFKVFMLVYQRLITFEASESEYMPKDFAYEKLVHKKLINLPVINTIALLYKDTNIEFVNSITSLYFDNTLLIEFQLKELEETVMQTLLIMEMVEGHVCGFVNNTEIVPIAIRPRPPIFDLSWVYSVVNYLLNSLSLLNTLLQFNKPAIQICIEKGLPFRIPSAYVTIYRELYELMDDRDELISQKELSELVFEEINLGRSEFVDAYHMFISDCLDKTLEHMGDDQKQEQYVELYLRLMTTALEEEYFICDYNMKYNVANQNDMFESCTTLLDKTRTEFITSCINKLPRNKRLQELSKLKKETIENVFKRFQPPEIEYQKQEEPAAINLHQNGIVDDDVEAKIKYIIDMFPHLGDGFVLKCLECYNYNSTDVINAILEENLPPHLYEIPFDDIRIPPEPEPEKPVLAYHGKKPDHADAMTLLNDKKDIKEFKSYILEGVQFTNDYLYDDEYDDREDYDVPIKVAENPLEKELLTYNPNHKEHISESSESETEDSAANGTYNNKDNRMNFCEDPAVLRERREARFKIKQKQPSVQQPRPSSSVVGKPKGQGQDKEVLKARDKKNVNKSSRANHNRKSGAQWKRNKGMIPM